MTYDPADNARKSYDVAIASMREARIRSGEYSPRPDNPQERQWASEGPVNHPATYSSRSRTSAGGRYPPLRPPVISPVSE